MVGESGVWVLLFRVGDAGGVCRSSTSTLTLGLTARIVDLRTLLVGEDVVLDESESSSTSTSSSAYVFNGLISRLGASGESMMTASSGPEEVVEGFCQCGRGGVRRAGAGGVLSGTAGRVK
jgi:hypothetical protein